MIPLPCFLLPSRDLQLPAASLDDVQLRWKLKYIHCNFFGGMHIVLYNYSQLLSHIVHVFISIFPPPIFIALESCNQLLNQQLVVAKSSSVLRHTKKMQFHEIGNEK